MRGGGMPGGGMMDGGMKRTVAFETLGCKLNQYETDSIATTLRRCGYGVIGLEPGADAYVLNSCTVTNKADRKSRNTLYRAERFAREGSGAPVIMTGCFVESHPDFTRPPSKGHVTYLVDNAHKNTIPDLLEAHFRGETVDYHTLAPDVFGFATPGQLFHTRTNIKVQDGCDNFCTFCIIPRVRGRAVSRPLEDVLREAEEAVAGGSRELVLTGVNMSRYREVTPVVPAADFPDLVRAILDLPGDFRLRISSLEPDGLDERFLELFDHPRMCPHLHLCLQSGSDRILLEMRRMYTRAAYRELAEKLRRKDRTFNLTTDVITGFPGETERDLEASLEAVGEHRFGHVHVFPFSPRSGTRAERIKGAVDQREKRRRSVLVEAAAVEEKRRYRASLVGGYERVLVERVETTADGDGASVGIGLGEHYVPVRFTAPGRGGVIRTNTFYNVRITGLEADRADPRLIGLSEDL
ncbi:MAG: tRNA (N(6)-L-threonylcarbamoyladenosine(37)-C(2))-methylthiotransferase MtaB [Spirochaetaceae bacterium]|nr:MAG: tRNA (N(6)-L-threonylcarbamoyladenosine(37)-C(2))-methylthiotransferase MtaB [Spirochaetaceae bacterium]